MDTSIKIFMCDLFIMWTVYLVANGINKYTTPTQNEKGGWNIKNQHVEMLRSSAFGIYALAWPFHVLIREFFT